MSITKTLSEVERFFLDIRYIGSFRTPPTRRYIFTGTSAAEIRSRGERAVDFLILDRLISKEKSALCQQRFLCG